MKKRHHIARPNDPRLPYPFYLLNQRQRGFLRALGCPDIRSIGQAFRCVNIERLNGHAVIEHWLDDPAFQDALFATLRSILPPRADQVRDVIFEFCNRRPIHKICHVPGPRSMQLSGWHAHRLVISRPLRVKRRSNSFSESGEDPWK